MPHPLNPAIIAPSRDSSLHPKSLTIKPFNKQSKPTKMKKNLNRTFSLAIITGMVILSQSACRKSVSPNTPPAVNFKNKAAYIYKDDSTSGHAYRGIMEPNNCGVVMVNENDCGTFDFSSFNMIVVDANTAKFNSPWSATIVNQINNSGKPILLLGEGGSRFGEALNLKEKW